MNALEQSMADVAKRHGFDRGIDITIVPNCAASRRFQFRVYWSDEAAEHGVLCFTGDGPTIAMAISEAIRGANNIRWPAKVAIADEPLPEIAA